jgi:hypothetical protein
MKCPECKKKMDLDRVDITQNQDTNKTYKREVYVCRKDDVWVTVETPKGNKQMSE